MPVKSKAKKPAKKAAAKRTIKNVGKSTSALSDRKLLKKAAKTKLDPKPAAKKATREKTVVQKPLKAEGKRPSARGHDGDHQYGSGYRRSNARIALKEKNLVRENKNLVRDKGIIAEPFVDERAPASSAVNTGNDPAIPYSSSHEAGMEGEALPGTLRRSGAIVNPWYVEPQPAHPERRK